MDRWSVCLKTCLAFLLCGALADLRAAELTEVVAGIGGHVRQGHWAELRFSLPAAVAAADLTVEIISRDGDGVPASYRSRLSPEETDSSRSFSALFKVGPPRSAITLNVRNENEIVATAADFTIRSHRSTSDVIALLGQGETGLKKAMEKASRQSPREIALVELSSAADLPFTSRGYECITRLCVVMGPANPLDQLTSSQRAALTQWLETGGQIIFVLGPQGLQHFAGQTPWREFLPGEPGEQRPLANATGIETYTGEPLPFSLKDNSGAPALAELRHVPRELVLQWESSSGAHDVPLLAEASCGAGATTWVLLDVTHPLLADWLGLPRLWDRLLAGQVAGGEETYAITKRGQVTHRGYQDLAGQLRMALDQYEAVTPIHFYLVAGVILAYACVLGPGEYFLLRKVMPAHMHVTWYLLPLLVGGMVMGGVWLGNATRGHVERMNHVELLDLDLVRGSYRGQAWSGLFTPVARSFSLDIEPVQLPAAEPSSGGQAGSWLALPGTGLGGVDTPALAAGSFQAYEMESPTGSSARIFNLAVPAAGSRLLHSRWQGTWKPVGPISTLKRKSRDLLEGTFRNPTPWTLRNVYLAHGASLYRAYDEVAPGATVHVERMERKYLLNQLTRRKVLASSDLATPWSADDTDVPRILEIMMFHSAVEGERYTVLTHQYQPELDWSRAVRQGYAVLLGKVAQPLVELREEGKSVAPETTRRWSYVRILYPLAAGGHDASDGGENSGDDRETSGSNDTIRDRDAATEQPAVAEPQS